MSSSVSGGFGGDGVWRVSSLATFRARLTITSESRVMYARAMAACCCPILGIQCMSDFATLLGLKLKSEQLKRTYLE